MISAEVIIVVLWLFLETQIATLITGRLLLLVITMWAGDKINNLYLGSKTIEKGTQSTKIRVLIGTNLTFCP